MNAGGEHPATRGINVPKTRRLTFDDRIVLMASVYLETSFVSACVERRAEPADIYRKDVSLEWWRTQQSRFDVRISAEVLRELGDPRYPLRREALEFVDCVEILPIDATVEGLSKLLVHEGVMPGPAERGDALHVAVATAHRVDFMLSWNVRHLANQGKLRQLRDVCLRAGLAPPLIVTPDYLWESET